MDVIVSGTILAGLCAPCCAKSELGVKDYSCVSACVIVGVGFLQLLLTACFLIGWVWSAIWGIALIGTACKLSCTAALIIYLVKPLIYEKYIYYLKKEKTKCICKHGKNSFKFFSKQVGSKSVNI